MSEIIPYVIWIAISQACAKYGVDEALFLAIGLTEKGPYAWTDAVIGDINNGWSFSPMQLNLNGAGAGKNPNDLTKPEVWAPIAASYIKQNLDTFNGNVELAVAAYNRGPSGTVDNYKKYVVPVMANYRRIQAEGITVVGSGDHDRQIFIPATKKWTGPYTEYAPNTGGREEALANLKGIATDALEAGRREQDVLKVIASDALIAADQWGKR